MSFEVNPENAVAYTVIKDLSESTAKNERPDTGPPGEPDSAPERPWWGSSLIPAAIWLVAAGVTWLIIRTAQQHGPGCADTSTGCLIKTQWTDGILTGAQVLLAACLLFATYLTALALWRSRRESTRPEP